MSDEEIDKAVKEAAEFEAQDKKRKEAIDARNEAESFVFQTEDALKQVGDQVDPADKSAVEADVAAVKAFLDAHKEAEQMTDADVAELKAAQEKLTQSAQKVFAKMYEQAQAAQVQQAQARIREQVLIWVLQQEQTPEQEQMVQMMMSSMQISKRFNLENK